MRRVTVIFAALIFTGALVAGCATAKRDVSTPSAALLGHWENTVPGGADVFYGPDTVYFSGGATKPLKQSYTVVSQNPGAFTIEVRYGQESGDPTEIVISKDGAEMAVYPGEMPEVLNFKYVDDRQSP
jgi:hypothetical protein